METVEMDACVSVYSGQSGGRRRSCGADVAAVINLDVDEDVDSLVSSPVSTLLLINQSVNQSINLYSAEAQCF